MGAGPAGGPADGARAGAQSRCLPPVRAADPPPRDPAAPPAAPRPAPAPVPAPAQPTPPPAAAMSKQPRAGREEILECQVMWEPDSKKNTQMDRFRAAVGAACGLALGECGLRGHHRSPRPPGRGLQKSGSPSGSEGPPGRGTPSWGPGRPLLRGVAVRALPGCWNNPLILSLPVPGLGGATGSGGPLPRGWGTL